MTDASCLSTGELVAAARKARDERDEAVAREATLRAQIGEAIEGAKRSAVDAYGDNMWVIQGNLYAAQAEASEARRDAGELKQAVHAFGKSIDDLQRRNTALQIERDDARQQAADAHTAATTPAGEIVQDILARLETLRAAGAEAFTTDELTSKQVKRLQLVMLTYTTIINDIRTMWAAHTSPRA